MNHQAMRAEPSDAEFESPFEDAGATWGRPQRSVAAPMAPVMTGETPFVSEVASSLGHADPAREVLAEVLSELYDREFDHAVYGLVHGLSEVAAGRLEGELGEAPGYEAHVERAMGDRLAPLARAAEQSLNELAEQLAPVDAASVSEGELETLLEAATPPLGVRGPELEYFLKKLLDKAKKVVKGAVKVIKKGVGFIKNVALKPVLLAFKKLIRPLLKKVLVAAMDKVPARYRPLANKLAQKLGFAKPVPAKAAGGKPDSATADPATSSASADGAGAGANGAAPEEPPAAATGADGAEGAAAPPPEPAAADVTQIQSELDWRIAEVMFAENDVESELAIASEESAANQPAAEPLRELERGRRRFIQAVSSLREEEDPAPLVENFIPAILAAVKIGLKLIGRKRVVGLLGRLIGTFIRPLVGKDLGPALGQAFADIGFKLLGLEVPAAVQAEAGPRAIARTVEETVQRVAALPEHVLDNEMLLESFVREAFDNAAAANFPPAALRAELHQAPGVEAQWVHVPPQGRAYYAKFSRNFDVKLERPVAEALRTFGGVTLAAFLRDRLGASFPARATVHLYKLNLGGRLAHIAARERVRGLGKAEAYRQLHPLTPHAAALLVQHPRLGTPFPPAPDPLRPYVGHHFYYLELHDAVALEPRGEPSQVLVHVDLPRHRISVRAHVAEPRAQQIAAELRKAPRGATLVHRLRQLLGTHLGLLASADDDRVLRITLDPPGPAERASLAGVAAAGQRRAIRQELAAVVGGWFWNTLARSAQEKQDEFVQATQAPENGVTLRLVVDNPPGMLALRRVLRGGAASVDDRWPPRETPPAQLAIWAGFRPD